MGKIIFWIILAGVVWAFWKSRAKANAVTDAPPRPAQNMVACAHCGVYLPESESLGDTTARYCSEAHRLAGPGAGQ